MNNKIKIGAYYYPGWHPCKLRDANYKKGFNEWSLVKNSKPRFSGHKQPKVPLWGYLNEAEADVFEQKITAANIYGIDFFVFASYWSRGRQILTDALNKGYLGACKKLKDSGTKNSLGFACMWANRMPRRVMPVKDASAAVIDPNRLVYTDVNDFCDYVCFLAENYFVRPEYYKVCGACYLSIFDTAFFIKQLGYELAKKAVDKAKELLKARGSRLHLAAIDPIAEHRPLLKQIGFDSVTHYVYLPEWHGDFLQDYDTCALKRQKQWHMWQEQTNLPYVPSVCTGWDSSARAADYGAEKIGKYPWSPIVTNSAPQSFKKHLAAAVEFAKTQSAFAEPTVIIASWNEWSEGHYLEPDIEYGYEWLEAIRQTKSF